MPKSYSENDLMEILYNAVGCSGEVGTKSAFTLQLAASYNKSSKELNVSGKSGYALGLLQYDFGARSDIEDSSSNLTGINLLIGSYNAWAAGNGQTALTPNEQKQLSDDLRTRGPEFVGPSGHASERYMVQGDPLRAKIDQFLTSDAGLQYVHALDTSVLKTSKGFAGLLPFAQQVAGSPTVQNMSDRDSECAIAALSKIFNQNPLVAGEIVSSLKGQSMDFEKLEAYISSQIAQSKHLGTPSKASLSSGVAATVRGMKLIDDIRSSPVLGPLWSASVSQDPSLESDFSKTPAKQFFDSMLRNPDAGEQVLAAIDSGQSVLIPTSKDSAKESYIAGVATDGRLFAMDGQGAGRAYANGDWTPFLNGGGLAEQNRHGQWEIASHSHAEHLAADSESLGPTASNTPPRTSELASDPMSTYLQLAAEVAEDIDALTGNQANIRSFRFR